MRPRVILTLLAIMGLVGGLTLTMAANTRSDAGFEGQRATPSFSGSGGGPACTADATVAEPVANPYVGNSCGGTDVVNSYAGTCTLPFSYGGEDFVYEIALGASSSVEFSLDITGSAGDLALFFIGTCDDGTSCVSNSSDNIGPGVGPEVIPTATYAAATYYLYIDSYYSAATPDNGSCGDFSLSVNGTLPAELINFSVE